MGARPRGLRLHLRVDVVPGASGAVLGIEKGRERAAVLRLRVAAQPHTGQANEAAMSLLARRLDLPRSALSLVAGETSRRKTVLIQGDPDDLARCLQALAPWFAPAPGVLRESGEDRSVLSQSVNPGRAP